MISKRAITRSWRRAYSIDDYENVDATSRNSERSNRINLGFGSQKLDQSEPRTNGWKKCLPDHRVHRRANEADLEQSQRKLDYQDL